MRSDASIISPLDRPQPQPEVSQVAREPGQSSDERTADAEAQYLGIELNDPLAPTRSLWLEVVTVALLGILFVVDLYFSDKFNAASLYVVVIFLALFLQRVRWVIGVTVSSLLLNLMALRWYPSTHNLERPDVTVIVGHLLIAMGAQIPAGILAYRSLVSQRRLERTRQDTMTRQRNMYERERAARSAEQEARRREMLSAEELRAHAAELQRIIESERDARKRESEMRGERDHLRRLTERFQRTLLAEVPEQIAGGALQLGSLYQPAIQEMQMGGDFYDAMSLPTGMVGLVIGDVAGHGVEAAAQTALVTTTLRAFATEDPLSPARVVGRVNRALTLDHNFSSFVSLFYGVYDPSTRVLRYANAGHEPPLLLRANDRCEPLTTTGLVVGVEATVAYEEREVMLGYNDCLIMITDGITEARDPDTNQMFGWEGVATVARHYRDSRLRPRTDGMPLNLERRMASAQGLADMLFHAALEFTHSATGESQGLADDVALLTVVAAGKPAASAPAPTPSLEAVV